MRKFCLLSLAALAVSIPAVPASAGTVVTGVTALKEWNVIVFENASSTSTVAGRTFIGGNLTGQSSGWLQGNNVPASAYGTPGLTVVGNVTGNTKNLVGGANVGGNVTSGFNFNGPSQTLNAGGSVSNTNVNQNTVNKNLNTSNPAFLTDLVAQRDALVTSLTDYSAALASLSATNSVTFANGNATFNVVPDAAGLAVFSITGSQLANWNNIQFNLNGADTVIVNVSGTDIRHNRANFNGTLPLSQHVVWNFHEATTLRNEREIWGSLVAPNAVAQVASRINGSVVVKQMTQTAQIHLDTYQGGFDPLAGGAVPEPATWLMLILGFGVVGGGLRRTSRVRFAQLRAAT